MRHSCHLPCRLIPTVTFHFLHSTTLTLATIVVLQMRNLLGWQRPQLTDGLGLPAGLSSSTDFSSGRLTPPTKPIAFPLQVPSVTRTPNFLSLSIAAANFDDSPSFFVIFPPLCTSHPCIAAPANTLSSLMFVAVDFGVRALELAPFSGHWETRSTFVTLMSVLDSNVTTIGDCGVNGGKLTLK